LPALDNDDLRRGKPTCHKVFGEAMAILAGDALLTLAFQALAGARWNLARRVQVIAEISSAAGTVNGMVGGQVADVEAGGKPVDAATLEYIHRSKTAALICGSIVAGPSRAARTRRCRTVAALRRADRLGVSGGRRHSGC
jgi:geranylgeranyl diphosphate synthase, type II